MCSTLLTLTSLLRVSRTTGLGDMNVDWNKPISFRGKKSTSRLKREGDVIPRRRKKNPQKTRSNLSDRGQSGKNSYFRSRVQEKRAVCATDTCPPADAVQMWPVIVEVPEQPDTGFFSFYSTKQWQIFKYPGTRECPCVRQVIRGAMDPVLCSVWFLWYRSR